MNDSPELTIVVPTNEGWPAFAPRLVALNATAARVQAELIVVDGSGCPAPAQAEIGPRTRWLSQPGASVFQLRLHGYRMARGRVIAATEDHCEVPIEWAETIVKAHREWPQAAVVGGVVDNGAEACLLDRANFYVNSIALAGPMRRGLTRSAVSHANVSYKRQALNDMNDHQGLGMADFVHLGRLRRNGALIYSDDRIRIVHVQSLSPAQTTAGQFHAGRCVSAFRRQQMGLVRWLQILGCFAIPIVRLVRVTRIGLARPYRRHVVASIPWMAWLLCAQAAGSLAGYVAGPGDSPMKVA